ncbi:hypothetical protein C8A00DRAFT_47037 [Chaetomidium leptoderma]|uniref:Uncharacterized protein n=1 Tax=Chaetomidium leptoderma TaxID=669021 RepID=A0AAN6ZUF1_9PEZI|nr:hypothetical protein C8A00DRAFT_47037 [Chaetomidium leptoderma]
METLDSTPTSPTRIPRPTFMAASPRTPSIRAVPYSHTDRAATASMLARSHSPSNWPFPNTTKPSPLDLSVTVTQDRDARGADLKNMSRSGSMKSRHRTTASAASASTMTGSLHQTARDGPSGGHTRANVSLCSVETQIYAPTHGGGSVPVEHARPNSARGSCLQPTAEIPERPMTPTPYSVLRKVSETSEPGDDDDTHPKSGQLPSAESQHQGGSDHPSAAHALQGSATQHDSVHNTGAKGSMNVPEVARATPVRRDEEGRVLSRLHPLFGSSAPNSESQRAQYTAASSSVQAEHGSSDAGTIAGAPEGIFVLKPAEVTATATATATAPDTGTPTRNNSLHSRRPATMLSEIPDLESLRLGPRLRHGRLPLSPSMAVNAGRSVPRSTKKLWSALGRSRKMMIISAILLELSILNVVSSITAVVATHIEQGYATIGLVAWAAVSSVFVLTFGGLLGVTFLQYRKTNKDLVSGESWIEMHLRSRPLPPRPQNEERKQDNGATEAWQKFVQDHEQLRRYVEFLESRIGVLEEGRPNASQRHGGSDADTVRVGDNAPHNVENDIGQPSGGGTSGAAGDNTPRAKKLNLAGSLSRRQLLQPEDSVTEPEPESWQGSGGNGAIPKSDTKASILTELCEAVTEGYSPLSEQMPRGSPQIPQTPNTPTPSAGPRGSTLRHLALPGRAVFHQRGVRSVDILKGKTEDT